MDRNTHILQNIDKSGRGLEIGPSHSPITARREGYNVEIIDHLTREQLVEKYTGHGVNVENIEDVDYVWQGESFAELTGNSNHYDWIISSHSIEHAPDLIGFLNDCEDLLKEGGVLSLAVPDKRFSFDHFRPATGLAQVIDTHALKPATHSQGKIAEHYLNAVSKNEQIAWAAHSTGDIRPVHDLQTVTAAMHSANREEVYLDVHAWCFVPNSFRLILHDLHLLGFTQLRELYFYSPVGSEFYITLAKSGTGPTESRMELLENIEAELRFSAPQAEDIIKAIEYSVSTGFMARIMQKLRS
ncbi:MAG: class I SAM-dependent methyltransferase [Arenicella sp.]|nr:class I SAM-dependent methyltransferase [Arenicella sp.]